MPRTRGTTTTTDRQDSPRGATDPRIREFCERNLRWRWVLPGGICSIGALLGVTPIRVAVVGAWLILLGIAVFSLLHRPIGASVASFGLGVLTPAAVPTALDLLDSL